MKTDLLLAALAGAWFCGCAQQTIREGHYFPSPADAVPKIADLLRAKDWATLACCYDLSGSTIDRADLESGAFFYTDEQPAVAHPAGFWRYKHPFAPAFEYLREEPTSDPNVSRVILAVEIDQGGGMVQRGLSAFPMVKRPQGWQIRPEQATAQGGAAPLGEQPSRNTLLRGLLTTSPEQVAGIDVFGQNPQETLTCFRSAGTTYLYDAEARTCEEAAHAKFIAPGTIGSITYDPGAKSFKLWQKGQLQLQLGVGR